MARQEISQTKKVCNQDLLKFMGGRFPPYTNYFGQNQNVEAASNVQAANGGSKQLVAHNTRLLVGNLPSDMTEVEFVQIFSKFGKMKEFFMNIHMHCAFVVMDTCKNAETTRLELDGQIIRGQAIHVRYPSAGGIAKKVPTNNSRINVQHLHPLVSNELLKEAFSTFGEVERAVVIVNKKGQSTGKGIVKFNNEASAQLALEKIEKGCFIMTTTARPVAATLDEENSEVGLPEQQLEKSTQYYSERQAVPRFAVEGDFEEMCAKTWKFRYNLERMQRAVVEGQLNKSRGAFEAEMKLCTFENMPAASCDEQVPKQVLQVEEEEEKRPEEDDEEKPEEVPETNGDPRDVELPRGMTISYESAKQYAINKRLGIIPVRIRNRTVTGKFMNESDGDVSESSSDEDEDSTDDALPHQANESGATRNAKSWKRTEAHKCPQCSKRYYYKASLVNHMKVHRLQCGYCDKMFNERSAYRRHVLTHTKTYVCDTCDRGYTSEYKLHKHKQVHPPEKTHCCPHCGEKFNQAGTLRRHVRMHTGENLAKNS